MKKLYRSSKQRVVAGVCGGIAEYFGIDPTIVRLAFGAGVLLCHWVLLAYAAAALIIPSDEKAQQASEETAVIKEI